MRKVRIVDDEKLVRESMEKLIPWDELKLLCIGSCENAFDAIDCLMEEKPDMLSSHWLRVQCSREFAITF